MIKRPDWTISQKRPENYLWLDKNENADPIYQKFLKEHVIAKVVDALSFYPNCYNLYEKVAEKFAVEVKNLIFAAGSDGVIRAAFEAFVLPGDKVIYINPTFAMYSVYCEIYKAQAYPIDYEDSEAGPVLTTDVLCEYISTIQPKLVCIPNPNSPTGTIFTPEEMERIIQLCFDRKIMILVDEAYYPFYDHTCIALINNFDNLIITRTFSKAWGLAGARVGVGIGAYNIIKQMQAIRPMYEIGNLSAMVVYQALDYPDQMLQTVQRINEGKKYFQEKMIAMGYGTYESHGNFFHVDFKDDAQAIHDELKKFVLYRHSFEHPSLKKYCRFSSAPIAVLLPILTKITQINQEKRGVK